MQVLLGFLGASELTGNDPAVFVHLAQHANVVEGPRLLQDALADDLGVDIVAAGDAHRGAVDIDHEGGARIAAQLAERQRFTIGAFGVVPPPEVGVRQADVIEQVCNAVIEPQRAITGEARAIVA